jgi:hypothetical protein
MIDDLLGDFSGAFDSSTVLTVAGVCVRVCVCVCVCVCVFVRATMSRANIHLFELPKELQSVGALVHSVSFISLLSSCITTLLPFASFSLLARTRRGVGDDRHVRVNTWERRANSSGEHASEECGQVHRVIPAVFLCEDRFNVDSGGSRCGVAVIPSWERGSSCDATVGSGGAEVLQLVLELAVLFAQLLCLCAWTMHGKGDGHV